MKSSLRQEPKGTLRQNPTNEARRGFLKGLFAAFLTPVVAKNIKADAPEPPKIKLDDYYSDPNTFCVSGSYRMAYTGSCPLTFRGIVSG